MQLTDHTCTHGSTDRLEGRNSDVDSENIGFSTQQALPSSPQAMVTSLLLDPIRGHFFKKHYISETSHTNFEAISLIYKKMAVFFLSAPFRLTSVGSHIKNL